MLCLPHKKSQNAAHKNKEVGHAKTTGWERGAAPKSRICNPSTQQTSQENMPYIFVFLCVCVVWGLLIHDSQPSTEREKFGFSSVNA